MILKKAMNRVTTDDYNLAKFLSYMWVMLML